MPSMHRSISSSVTKANKRTPFYILSRTVGRSSVPSREAR